MTYRIGLRMVTHSLSVIFSVYWYPFMFWYNPKILSAIREKEFGLSRICF